MILAPVDIIPAVLIGQLCRMTFDRSHSRIDRSDIRITLLPMVLGLAIIFNGGITEVIATFTTTAFALSIDRRIDD
ncbi:MAG: hypothetical protein V7677_17470 [Motiliproteus sp.]